VAFKKIHLIFTLGLMWPLLSCAGTEDWHGTFLIQTRNNTSETVEHTPSKVHFLYFTTSGCLYIGKGTKIKGLDIKENVRLCKRSTVETFTNEVKKLGLLTDQTITLGPSYSTDTPKD